MGTSEFTEYTQTTAHLAILKAKAAITCPAHPHILIRSRDGSTHQRAYMIALNTLKYNDRVFLSEELTTAVKMQLENAALECQQCAGSGEW